MFVEKTEAHCHAHLFQKLASTVVAKLIGHWLICLKLCSKLDMENVQVSEHMRFTVPIVGSCNCFKPCLCIQKDPQQSIQRRVMVVVYY